MLTAAALNALTACTGIDTVVHLETPSAEIFLYYGVETPVALRRTLSPVFVRLRQTTPAVAAAQSSSDADHIVDRLHKLADLLERGLLSEDEFADLKAALLAERG